MASIGFFPNVQAASPTTVMMDFTCQSVGTTTGAIPAANITAGRSIKALTGSYAATGVYTFTLPYGSAFPAGYLFKAQAYAIGPAVFLAQVDSVTYANGQMTITVKCYNPTTGAAVAPLSTAGILIGVSIAAGNNTGG